MQAAVGLNNCAIFDDERDVFALAKQQRELLNGVTVDYDQVSYCSHRNSTSNSLFADDVSCHRCRRANSLFIADNFGACCELIGLMAVEFAQHIGTEASLDPNTRQ